MPTVVTTVMAAASRRTSRMRQLAVASRPTKAVGAGAARRDGRTARLLTMLLTRLLVFLVGLSSQRPFA